MENHQLSYPNGVLAVWYAMWLLEINDLVDLYCKPHTKPPKLLRDRGLLNEVIINVYMNGTTSVYYVL